MVSIEVQDEKSKFYKGDVPTILIHDPLEYTVDGDMQYILVDSVIGDDGGGLSNVIALYDEDIDAYKCTFRLGTKTDANSFQVKASDGNIVTVPYCSSPREDSGRFGAYQLPLPLCNSLSIIPVPSCNVSVLKALQASSSYGLKKDA